MVVRRDIDVSKGPSSEQIAMLKKAAELPVGPDDDCPAYSVEQLREMKRLTDERRVQRNKQTVTLRLSPEAIRKARSLGKGYTSVLSRIIEQTLNDTENLKNYL